MIKTRMKVAAIAGVAALVGISTLIAEGSALERIFSIGEVSTIDFASVERTDRPNQYLMCPKDLCLAAIDDPPPIFAVNAVELRGAWEALMQTEPRIKELRRDADGMQIDYVQRSRILRFPDLITVRFIAVGENASSLAIYSRSIYGQSDLGVNKARIRTWIARLTGAMKLD